MAATADPRRPGAGPGPAPRDAAIGPGRARAETADWRDAMIEKGRQEWQPKVVQPDGTLPHPPQAKDPEISS